MRSSVIKLNLHTKSVSCVSVPTVDWADKLSFEKPINTYAEKIEM